jgi:hypothetical protein
MGTGGGGRASTAGAEYGGMVCRAVAMAVGVRGEWGGAVGSWSEVMLRERGVVACCCDVAGFKLVAGCVAGC